MQRQSTDRQKLAIESNARDICVSAGAGSGKTGVLVERYIRIVTESLTGKLPITERAGVSEILVVTFTDRATKEMKSRIVDALNERGLIEERRQLETAYISTIHGLCSRLLKEHPLEAGIDPGFTVLDESDAMRMIRVAFDGVVVEGYRAQESEVTDLIVEVINDRTFDGSDLDGLPLLALEAEAVMRKLRGAGVTLDELQRILQNDKPLEYDADPVQALLQPTYNELAACVDDLRRIAVDIGGIVQSAAAMVLDSVSRMRVESDVVTRIGNVHEMSSITKKARTLVGSASTGAGVILLLDRIQASCERVSELFGVSAEFEAMSRLKCRRFLGLICKMWYAYAAAKRVSGLLDNNDLMTECVRLLDESPDVRRLCQRKFRHLMIDEFQDTDTLQARLLELLHGSSLTETGPELAKRDTDVACNSLFIVGDVQQSIYGFRYADPEIFRAMESRFRNDISGLHVQLSDNFRSRPEILRLVQQVFNIAWRGESTPFVPLQSAVSFENKPEPSIELLLTMNMARREYVHLEADAIAMRIRAIVEGPDAETEMDHRVKISAKNDPSSGALARYGDVAVLLRGLTDIRDYEEAFARHGVPALVTAGGRGYYARYEIQDLLCVLTLLDSPLNDSALLTALRSPFVGADIDTIYRLGMLVRSTGSRAGSNGERAPLYTALKRLLASPELPAIEQEKIVPFLSAVERLRSDVDRISVGRLIDRLIVQTNYDMRLLCRPGGRRKLANVRKLVQIALAEPGLSVYEFVGRMRDLQVLSDREGDAPAAEEGESVVRIMSVHAAKGLEFPIVVLPDLSRGLISPETGLFTCDPASRTIGSKSGGEPDAAYRAIAKRKQEADKREYLRLLYVAITRAREHLLLCGNVGRNRGFNWADVVFRALGITSVPSVAERRVLDGGVEALVVPLLSWVAAAEDPSSSLGFSHQRSEQYAENLLRVHPPDIPE